MYNICITYGLIIRTYSFKYGYLGETNFSFDNIYLIMFGNRLKCDLVYGRNILGPGC